MKQKCIQQLYDYFYFIYKIIKLIFYVSINFKYCINLFYFNFKICLIKNN